MSQRSANDNLARPSAALHGATANTVMVDKAVCLISCSLNHSSGATAQLTDGDGGTVKVNLGCAANDTDFRYFGESGIRFETSIWCESISAGNLMVTYRDL